MTRQTDLAWAAGISEGEGTAGYHSRRSGLRFSIAQSEPGVDMLYEVQRILGSGKVRKKTPLKKGTYSRWSAYAFEAYGINAATIIRLVLPYMRVAYKRAQFIQALEQWRSR